MEGIIRIISFTLIFFQFLSCHSPDDYGERIYFELDEPAYDFECGSFESFDILKNHLNYNEWGIYPPSYSDNLVVVYTISDSLMCYNTNKKEKIWAIDAYEHNYRYLGGNIIGNAFVYSREQAGKIKQYIVDLNDGSKSEIQFGQLQNKEILDIANDKDNLIIFFSEKMNDRHYILNAWSWNYASQNYKELFSYSLEEELSIKLLYWDLIVENGSYFFVSNYESDGAEKKVILFKYSNVEEPNVKHWQLKGEDLHPNYNDLRTSVIKDKFIYASQDTLYSFDTNKGIYDFIKTPARSKLIERLKVSDEYIIVQYESENYLIESKDGNTVLKPEKFQLLIHPTKHIYFDRPVGNLNTLAIRDLASGKMLCEKDINFDRGAYAYFFNEEEDKLIILMRRQIVIFEMPDEL